MKDSEIRTTRWRVTFSMEFDVRGYETGEQHTAEFNADIARRALQRADRDINCSRAVVKVEAVERA